MDDYIITYVDIDILKLNHFATTISSEEEIVNRTIQIHKKF